MVIGFWPRDRKAADPRARRALACLCVVMLIGLAALLVWRATPNSETFYTDADTIRQPLATAPIRDILWQPPAELAELLNTTVDDYEPRISADGRTLFFVRGKAGENADIFTSTKTHQGWAAPVPVVAVNSDADELGPAPTADGRSLYLYSNREGTFGGYDLWVARRGRDGWTAPVNLGPRVNSPFNDYGPAPTPDGGMLYFSSNRPQGSDEQGPDPGAWSATLREDHYYRTYDLYAASVNDRGVGAARPVVELNTPFNEGAPAVSPYGDFLYFSSDRAGGQGAFDLYRSRRLHGGYREATNLGAPVNTAANELDPALAMGGFALYFSSDRDGQADSLAAAPSKHGASSHRKYNLFVSTSREVFADTDRRDREPINWAALWGAIGPNLLWALLALLALLAMLSLYRAMKERKISLLAKCLLASLAAHLLLLMLMSAWEVAAAVAGEFNRRGRIHVTIASPSSGDAIASQIRGEWTQIAPPKAALPPLQRLDVTTRPAVAIDPAALDVDRAELKDDDGPASPVSVADAISRPRSEWPVPRQPLEPPSTPPAFQTALPHEPARIDAPEKRDERPVETERFPLATRAHVNMPTGEDATRVDFSPVRAPLDLGPIGDVIAAAPVDDPQEALPSEPAPLYRGPPERALPAVDVELVRPATPPDRAPVAEMTEDRFEVPPAGRLLRAQHPVVESEVATYGPFAAGTSTLSPERGAVKLEESAVAKIEVTPEAADATFVAGPAPREPQWAIGALPALPVAGDLAIPKVAPVQAAPAERPPADVEPRRTTTPRPPIRGEIAERAEVDTVGFDSPVAPTEVPAEHRPKPVTFADAGPADRSVLNVVHVAIRAPVASPQRMAPAALALPPAAQAEPDTDADPEPAIRVPDPAKRTHGRRRGATHTFTETPAPNAFFFDGIVPRPTWEDRPLRSVEEIRPPDVCGVPVPPVPADSRPPPVAAAIPAELDINTLDEEIAPQLAGNDSAKNNIIGLIGGRITDRDTGEPLPRARVHLMLPLVGSIVAIADRRGEYELDVPDVPDFFAVSATLDGYIPHTKSVGRDHVEGRRLRVDFELTPQDRAILVTEVIPDVHHLGDNRFEGRINSQFQKESEGDRYETTFRLDGDQVPPHVRSGEVVLLAKGVQRSHRLFINGVELEDRLDDAPSDGSFGEFVAPFDGSVLREGENTLEIIAKPSDVDIDDFEFVNVRIRLIR